MSQRYPSNGQGYTSNQLPNPHRPSNSNDVSHIPTSFPTSHSQALPPLSTPNTFINDPHQRSRLEQLQPAAFSDTTFHAIYAPTANTYVPHDLPAPQPNFAQNPVFTSSGQRPGYTSAAPPNLNLPRIQPAPHVHDEVKQEPKETLQPLASAPPAPGKDPGPRHVVGSQGRRGILPSASGRPPAAANPSLNDGKNSPALVKDADGKYPCPHCNKPYLHQKHLKRHMLRHTGYRPYECALCHDTFSRSDILKRHFQKCSVRRGNPTGENHLAYSRANKKARQQEEEQQMAANLSALTTEQATVPMYATVTSSDSPLGLHALDISNGFERQEPLANQVTRSNELRRVNGVGGPSNRGSTSSINNFVDLPPFSTGHVTPDSVTTSGAATPYTYPHERSSLSSPADPSFNHMNLGIGGSRTSSSGYPNGLPNIMQPNGRADNIDWSHFNQFSSEDFGGQQYHSGTSTPHHAYKQETDFPSFEWLQSHPKP